jgi:ActR/RegA family two-component response regulator
MLMIFSAFFKKNLLMIVGWVAAALAVTAVLLGARSAGRKAEQVDQMKNIFKSVEKANAIEREVSDSYRRTGNAPDRVSKFYLD